jgi:4a-hydroxytetrahydrobiopterin dehydratase
MSVLKKRALGTQTLTFGAEFLDIQEPWNIEDGKLVAKFLFSNFEMAKRFVDEISILAELQHHHPDISFGWGYVHLVLFSHDEQKITQRDIILANAISKIE